MYYETCYQCGDAINIMREPYREKYVNIPPALEPLGAPPMPKIARVYAHESCAWNLPEWGYAHKVEPRF